MTVRALNMDDEMHGLAKVRKVGAGPEARQAITLAEAGARVRLELSSSIYPADLTPDQARYLARKLHRLARRADERRAPVQSGTEPEGRSTGMNPNSESPDQ